MPKLTSVWIAILAIVVGLTSAYAAERVALVIGVEAYSKLTRLQNPNRDARAIAARLRQSGFAVSEYTDLDHEGFKKAVDEFAVTSKDAKEAILFFSGHGMGVVQDGRLVNALAPRDAEVDCATRSSRNIFSLEEMIKKIEHVPSKVALFDACRSDPFPSCSTPGRAGFGFRDVQISSTAPNPTDQGTRGTGDGATRGFVAVGPASQDRLLVAYSTDLGALALDGETGGHSPFAQALLDEMAASGRTPLREVLDRTSRRVAGLTKHFQVPWVVTRGGEPDMCLDGANCEFTATLKTERLLQESNRRAVLSAAALESGNTAAARALAVEALPDPESWSREHVSFDAERALYASYYRDRETFFTSSRKYLNAAVNKTLPLIALPGKDELKVVNTASGRVHSRIPVGQLHQRVEFSGWELLTVQDKLVQVWDANEGAEIERLEPPTEWSRFKGAAFCPHDRRIAVASNSPDGDSMQFWRPQSSKPSSRIDTRFATMSVQLSCSKDGSRLLGVDGWGGEARIWNTETGSVVGTFQSEIGELVPPLMSPDNRGFLMGRSAHPNTLFLSDIKDSKAIGQLDGHDRGIYTAAFSADGKYIATGADDRTARIWTAADGKPVHPLSGHSTAVYALAFSPNPKADPKLLTGSGDGEVRLWDVKSGRLLSILQGHSAPIVAVAFAPYYETASGSDDTAKNEPVLAVTADKAGNIIAWEVAENGRAERQHTFSVPLKGDIKLSHTGSSLVAEWDDKTITAWNMLSRFSFEVLAMSSNGHHVAHLENRQIEIRDTASGTKSATLDLKGMKHTYALKGVFLKDGEGFITGGDDSTIRIWSFKSQEPQRSLSGHSAAIKVLALSPDGSRLASAASDGTARVWDLASGTSKEMRGHDSKYLNAVAFSRDGKLLLTGSDDKTARLWDVETATEIKALEGHSGNVRGVAFSPNEKWIATATEDELLIWDAKGHQGLKKFILPRGSALYSALRFHPTSEILLWRNHIISMSRLAILASLDSRDATTLGQFFTSDGRNTVDRAFRGITLRPFFADSRDLVSHTRQTVRRCLTPAERQRFALPADPPDWCISQGKWPYDTDEWKDWLSAKKSTGKTPPMPKLANQ